MAIHSGPRGKQFTLARSPDGDTECSTPSYALYSSFSPFFQKYLESLYAVHSGVAQADGNRAAGLPVRREPIETIHPVVRVNPATGWKSIYVNPGKPRTSSHPSTCLLTTVYYDCRFHPPDRRCAQGGVRRYPKPALPPTQREPRLPGALPLGAQLHCHLGQPGA